jgi:short-subunit dehydrogenase
MVGPEHADEWERSHMSALRPVTLITGASAGIGAALASVFAEHGHELVLAARRAGDLSTVADKIAQAGHQAATARPHVLPIDLAQRGASDRLAEELAARGLEPAIVVNNAGFGLYGEAARLDRAAQLDMIELNMRALTDLSLRFLDGMARYRGGILNVASLAAFVPGPSMAVYHASKVYALSLSEALHQELKPKGVKVTVLCPGPVKTEFQERSGMGESLYPRFLARSAERVALEGYEGFMAGRRVVIPGSHNKVAAALLRLLPRGAAVALARRSRTLT